VLFFVREQLNRILSQRHFQTFPWNKIQVIVTPSGEAQLDRFKGVVALYRYCNSLFLRGNPQVAESLYQVGGGRNRYKIAHLRNRYNVGSISKRKNLQQALPPVNYFQLDKKTEHGI